MTPLSTELVLLVLSATWCVLLFVPYAIARMRHWDVQTTVGFSANPPPLPLWGQRAYRAHMNMVENLVPFAAVVLTAAIGGIATPLTAAGAVIFFAARIVHSVVYIAGIPWVRTIAFAVSLVGEGFIIVEVLRHGL